MYSQNQEEQYILSQFKNFIGTLLDIGANDGRTFSNSLRLIELGWQAVLVEPSEAGWEELLQLHGDNERVTLMPCAIARQNGKAILHESGAHVIGGEDKALVSTLRVEEKNRWRNVTFDEKEVDTITYSTLCERCKIEVFDFISIDAEGMDLEILRQIDLTETKLLCIEWNSNHDTKFEILKHTSRYGMRKIIYQSAENILIAK